VKSEICLRKRGTGLQDGGSKSLNLMIVDIPILKSKKGSTRMYPMGREVKKIQRAGEQHRLNSYQGAVLSLDGERKGLFEADRGSSAGKTTIKKERIYTQGSISKRGGGGKNARSGEPIEASH